jgi:hypothetical protein
MAQQVAFLIPLQPTPQTLTVVLNGVEYVLRLQWNVFGNYWVLDLNDGLGNPLVLGVPIVTGADIMEQFQYLGLGGEFIVQTTNDVDAVPTFTNLGTSGNLYYVVAQ